MKEKKKLVISISLIVVLILAIIGISYAAFTYIGRGEKVNQITTGTISMEYIESDNVISINNALPTTDETGKVRLNEGEYFDFSVTTNISGGAILNYEIAAEDFEDNTFDGSNVKFYLTKLVGNEEVVINENLPTTYSEVTSENTMTGRPINQMSLLTGSTSEQGSVTTNYRLRLYVSDAYNPQGDGGNLVFKTRINVYGKISTDGLVMKSDFLLGNVEKASITSIETKNTVNVPETAIKNWDVSELGNGNVIAYIEDDGLGTNTYKLTLAGRGSIVAPTDSTRLFSTFENATSIDLSYLDTSNVTNMYCMFLWCSNLTSLNISNFDTSNVTSMRSMFNRCSSLENLDLSHFDTSNVTTMNAMFYICTNLTSINMSSFDTSHVTNFRTMFYECNHLINVDVSNFDTSSATDMYSMFNSCSSLENLDLTVFDISNVVYLNYMFAKFANCTNLTNISVSNLWIVSDITTTEGIFTNCGCDHVTVV